ncbi:MAG: hypothetical protein HYZ89_03790 [Candidatus Omnitrophica bacterium]|nr:hypothetical protein [Candidatus Omnitrophota bacterium]
MRFAASAARSVRAALPGTPLRGAPAAVASRLSDRARGPAAQRRDGEEVSPPAEAATVARCAR